MQIAPAGDRALLVDLGDVTAEELHALNQRAEAVRGVVRSTPGHSSLYVIFSDTPDRDALVHALQSEAPFVPRPREREIAIAFDGADLDEFLVHVPITREDFLRRIDGLRLTARYLGFRGGFAYLDGWPEEWSMPRRATSRPVARGSFAVAGNVAGFYPIDSPGGWNLLGRTDADVENRISAGDVIVLRVRRELPITFHAPLALVTDRPFDDVAAALANCAVGNDVHAPVLECPLVCPRVTFTRDATIAWCSPSREVRVERVRAGEERTFGRVVGGLRGYMAIWTAATPVAALTGDEVRAATSVAAVQNRLIIRAMRGPHPTNISDVECEVTPQLDRVGIRLRPLHALDVKIPADLRSIGMQCGTVQLHPDGSLVAMGPDHPITGGYLQPLTVLAAERWKLAQLVPGERVTLRAEFVP
jgi:allophanate hydrolase subunit 1